MRLPLPVFEPETGDGAPQAQPPVEMPSNSHLPADDAPPAQDQEFDFMKEFFSPMQGEAPEDADIEESPIGLPPGEDLGTETQAAQGQLAAESPPQGAVPTQQAQQVPGQATPPVQQAVAQAAAVQQGLPTQGQHVVPQQAAVQQAQVDPAQAFARIQEEVQKHAETFTSQLRDTVYKIDDKKAEELGFTPEQAQAVSDLQAKLHVNVVGSLMRVLNQNLEQQVVGIVEKRTQSRQREDLFWSSNPNLDRSKHEQAANALGAAWRQMNPTASREEFIREVGALVATTFKVSPVQALAAHQQQQVAPVAPVVRTPGPVVRQVNGGFSPANPHGAPPGAYPAPQRPYWESVMHEMNRLEEGEL